MADGVPKTGAGIKSDSANEDHEETEDATTIAAAATGDFRNWSSFLAP